MTEQTHAPGLWSAPGDGVLARAGDLILLSGPADAALLDRLLEVLEQTAAAGGDGRRLADAIEALLGAAGPPVIALGPSGTGLVVLVTGTAWADVSTAAGTQQLAAGQPGCLLRGTLRQPVIAVHGGLEPGRRGAGRTDRYSHLDRGSVRAGGLSYYSGSPAPEPPAPAPEPPAPAPEPPAPAAGPEQSLTGPQPPAPGREPPPAGREPPAVPAARQAPEPTVVPEPDEPVRPEPVPAAPEEPDEAARPQPATSQEEPGAGRERRAAGREEPGASQEERAAGQEERAAGQEGPSAGREEPGGVGGGFGAAAARRITDGVVPPLAGPPPPAPPAAPPADRAPAADRASAAGQPFDAVLLTGESLHEALSEAGDRPPLPPAAEPAPAGPGAAAEPMIMGAYCKNGHFDDPEARFCAVCGISMNQQTLTPRLGPRPPLGLLLLDTGAVLQLDANYVIGREPELDPAVLAGEARPLPIPDATGTLSRVHAQIQLVGWNVLVTDLGSANGTRIRPPGDSGAEQLIPRVPTLLRPGSRVDLGGRRLHYESHRGR